MNPTDQAARWNGTAGQGWVAAQPVLDVVYRPLVDALVNAIPPGDARRILDIGCGTGATTVAAARRGRCVGVDISEPMVTAARDRAGRVGSAAEFIQADAQRHPFDDGEFDTLISQFGVMFFDDPQAAFTNLRRACTEDAAMRFVVWRGAEENPFMTAAEPAARQVLPELPARPTSGPGPFAFADPDYTRELLRASGWSGVDVRALDIECTMSAADLEVYLTRIGPLGLALHDADEDTRVRALDVVRPAFDPWVHGDEIRLPAACWLIVA